MKQAKSLLTDEKLAQIAAGKMWDFHGGVHPQDNKKQSAETAIEDAGIPEQLIIGVEYKGNTPEILVKVGDKVLTGQPLTKVYGAFVVQHASSSGTVKAIEPRTDCHPSGLPVLSIVIETDGLDTPYQQQGFADYQREIPATLIEAIQQAGIVGLGGAGFPTHLKLGQQDNRLLIINAIECEPYITADDRLTREYAADIIVGTQILQHILNPKLTIFAIEDNKPEAIQIFKEALARLPEELQKNFIIKVVPTRYPSGSAKQLIELLTGEQTPIGKHASHLGIVMQNVGTAFAVKEAIVDGKPLLSRVVTLTGDAFNKKGNAWVRIGTPMQYLLDKYQYQIQKKQSDQQKLIVGGPMMGFTVNDPQMPVTKICNCLLAPTHKEMPPAKTEMNCIRCGECADACPAELLPQQLLWYSKSEDHKKLEEYDLSACIECGACAFVCPSHIPLVEYYRVSKAQIASAQEEANKATIAKQRHESRLARLEKEKEERQRKHKQAAQKRVTQSQSDKGGQDLIAAALARAKAKKAEQQAGETAPAKEATGSTPNNAAVAAAIARAKAKKAAQQAQADSAEQVTDNEEVSSPGSTPKNAAVAAAIARAKAKKAAKQAEQSGETAAQELTTDTPQQEADPKKAAVAAAIARAKAKKAAKQAEQNSEVAAQAQTTNAPQQEADPKKAAVAAAIARAKAKKAAQQAEQNSEAAAQEQTTDAPQQESEPKKAAVAAAIARAKAKKAAKQAEQSGEAAAQEQTADEPQQESDPKKAAVAAAIARAKAKKQAREAKQNGETPVDTQTPVAEQEILPDNSEVIEQRKKRKEQARLYKEQRLQAEQQKSSKQDSETEQKAEPQQKSISSEQPEPDNKESENKSSEQQPDRKAAIARAIAKAKAKKLAEKDQ